MASTSPGMCNYPGKVKPKPQFDLSACTAETKKFISHEFGLCTSLGISANLENTKSVQLGNLKVNGYFSEEDKSFAVAIKKPIDEWLPIFVHETCHRDQWSEQTRIWTQTVRGCEPIAILDLWLSEVVELKPITQYQMIMGALKVELDCEKRSAKKIKKWKLPIDVKEYAQKANSYIYFYHMLGATRKWYDIGTEPYNIEEVWKEMPDHFNNDYTKLPTMYKTLFIQHCYNGKTRK